jgi:hypothetical protein
VSNLYFVATKIVLHGIALVLDSGQLMGVGNLASRLTRPTAFFEIAIRP